MQLLGPFVLNSLKNFAGHIMIVNLGADINQFIPYAFQNFSASGNLRKKQMAETYLNG